MAERPLQVQESGRLMDLLHWLWGTTDRHHGGPEAFEEAASLGLIELDGLWKLSDAGRAALGAAPARRYGGERQSSTERTRLYRQDEEKREKDRERSRRWKRDHLGQPGQPKGTDAV